MKNVKYQQKIIKFLRAGIRCFGLIIAVRFLFYPKNKDCWAARGDMVPMEFHDTSFFRGNKHFDIKEEVIPDMKEYYQNVSERFYYLFWAYAVMNFFEVIYNSMLLIFKGNKGLLKNMEKIDLVMPILMLAWIITFICESMKTTSRVCFWIYKDAFYYLKEAKKQLEPLA
jgi:hypothetical protein